MAGQSGVATGLAIYFQGWLAVKHSAWLGNAAFLPCILAACRPCWRTWCNESLIRRRFWQMLRLFAALNSWQTRRSFVCSRKPITFAWQNAHGNPTLSFFAKHHIHRIPQSAPISCKLKLTVLQCTQAQVSALVLKESNHGEATYSSGHH